MSCWDVLGIDYTTDKRKIKRAYARLVAKIHPEEDEEGFKNVYAAYEQALALAENKNVMYQENNNSILEQQRMQRQIEERKRNRVENENIRKSEDTQEDITKKQVDFGMLEDHNVQWENPSISTSKAEIDFEQLVEKKKLRLVEPPETAPSDIFNIKVENNEEIDALLNRFDNLIYSKSVRKVKLWKELTKSEEFLEYRHNELFLEKLNYLMGRTPLPAAVASVVFAAFKFDELENKVPEEVYRRLKLHLMEAITNDSQDIITTPTTIGDVIKLILYIILVVGIVGAVLFIRIGRMSNLYDMLTAPTNERLENILENSYDDQFAISEMETPTDIMEIYYLISNGKKKEDYQWFNVCTSVDDLPVVFYASYNEEDSFQYDFCYRLMFAMIENDGLGGYLDDIDKYNLEYYDRGEQRYVYPVLLVSSGLDDEFYTRLYGLMDKMSKTEELFSESEHVTINIANVKTGHKKAFHIEEDKTIDLQTICSEIERLEGY